MINAFSNLYQNSTNIKLLLWNPVYEYKEILTVLWRRGCCRVAAGALSLLLWRRPLQARSRKWSSGCCRSLRRVIWQTEINNTTGFHFISTQRLYELTECVVCRRRSHLSVVSLLSLWHWTGLICRVPVSSPTGYVRAARSGTGWTGGAERPRGARTQLGFGGLERRFGCDGGWFWPGSRLWSGLISVCWNNRRDVWLGCRKKMMVRHQTDRLLFWKSYYFLITQLKCNYCKQNHTLWKHGVMCPDVLYTMRLNHLMTTNWPLSPSTFSCTQRDSDWKQRQRVFIVMKWMLSVGRVAPPPAAHTHMLSYMLIHKLHPPSLQPFSPAWPSSQPSGPSPSQEHQYGGGCGGSPSSPRSPPLSPPQQVRRRWEGPPSQNLSGPWTEPCGAPDGALLQWQGFWQAERVVSPVSPQSLGWQRKRVKKWRRKQARVEQWRQLRGSSLSGMSWIWWG